MPLAAIITVLLAAGCASAPRSTAPEIAAAGAPPPATASPGASPLSAEGMGLYRPLDKARLPPTPDERAVVDSARLLVGQKPSAKVTVNGRTFVLDCIGTVAATFWRMSVDVQKDFSKYSGNGVKRLYASLEALGALHADRYPRPGDIVFWDNTWDANGDGNRANDPRTHAGIVLAVDDDGTLHYLHSSIAAGVVIEVMNLLHPGSQFDQAGKRINSSMAIATVSGGPRPAKFLAGDVFWRFGDLLAHKRHFLAAEPSGIEGLAANGAGAILGPIAAAPAGTGSNGGR